MPYTPPDPRYLAGKIDYDRAATVTAWHLIIPSNPRRIRLHITGPNAGRVTVTNDAAGTQDNGLTMSLSFGMLDLDYERDGDIVKKPWYGIGSAATAILSWCETEDLSD